MIMMTTVIGGVCAAETSGITPGADLTRIRAAMARLKAGETITVAAIGGSITTGYAAVPTDVYGWAGRVAAWWRAKATESGGKVNWLNQGVSGTDSAFASVRVGEHIVDTRADVVFVEFAMNDQWLEKNVRNRSYEGVLRHILADSDRAAYLLFVCEKGDGKKGQQAEQEPIGAHYKLPMLSWADRLQPQVAAGQVDWATLFNGAETVHPNNAGHASIAGFITAQLDELWNTLPAAKDIPAIDRTLPPALNGDDFQNPLFIGSDDLAPASNVGWVAGSDAHNEWVAHGGAKQGWHTTDPAGEITFAVNGKSVGLMYAESDQYRNAEAWVEYADGTAARKKITLACQSPSRVGYLGWAYRELANNPVAKDMVIHVRVKKARATENGKAANFTGIVVTGAAK
jgi:lysophospholipase L1-like esterase